MKIRKIHDKIYTARNFSSSPLSVSGLLGNTFDYVIIAKQISTSSSTVDIRIQLNSDTTSNYRRYFMQGQSTTASAGINDSQNWPVTVCYNSGATGLVSTGIFKISNSSGSERYISGMTSYNSGASTTGIRQEDGYWKNTANELTSIDIYSSVSIACDLELTIYEIPKSSNLDGWEYVNKTSWSAVNTVTLFSSLTGNTDTEYMIIADFSDSGSFDFGWRLNGDSSSNYISEQLRNSAGAIGCRLDTQTEAWITAGGNPLVNKVKMIINAESGNKRLCYTELSNSGTGYEQVISRSWWGNTVDELTSVSLVELNNSTGTAKLYRKKKPSLSADLFNLPFSKIKTVSVSGDFSAGHDFTGLLGNSRKLYKLEGLFSTLGTGISLRLNSDSSSNYIEQTLQGATSSVTAVTATRTFIKVVDSSVSKVAKFTMYFYPVSGNKRIVLIQYATGENTIGFRAFWWGNTVDELNSIKPFADNSSTCTGNITLSEFI